MSKSSVLAVAIGLLLIAAPAANAKGFYVGGSLGQTSADLGVTDSIAPNISVDDSDTGFKVFGGYNVAKYFAVEAAWVDVASFSLESTDPILPASITGSADGFAVEAMGILPLGKSFELFAEYGMYLWDGTTDISMDGQSLPSASTDGTDPTFGVGFSWQPMAKGQLRFEAERYAIESMDVDMYSVGFAYRF
jgi:OOP family OmpA-OmpF porin